MPSMSCEVRSYSFCRPLWAWVSVLVFLAGCGESDEWRAFSRLADQPTRLDGLQREQILNAEPVRALQAVNPEVVNSPLVLLGKQLFNDARLSADDSLSCASCHDITAGGDDGRVVSLGIHGQLGSINAPTVLNSGHSFRQFWDGRASSLAQQALGPVESPVEMGARWQDVVLKLSSDDALLDLFEAAFETRKPTAELIVEALAAFERTLLTPAPFDDYLNGDIHAISGEAVAGYGLFKEYGCVACHQGVNLGGNVMQYLGAFHAVDHDVKQSSVQLGSIRDNVLYKVPTLRNIALTSPYFHMGSVADLSDAVKIMGAAQLGRIIEDGDVELLVAFLESLSGRVPEHALTPMQLTNAQ